MISRSEVRRRLMAVIELQGFGSDRERMLAPVVNMLSLEVLQIVKEEVSKAKPKLKDE